MLNEEMELEVTEGEPDAVTDVVTEAEGDGVVVTEGESVVLSVTDGEVVTEEEELGISVIEAEEVGATDIVAVAVVADPRAQQKVTLVEKVLPSINWHP